MTRLVVLDSQLGWQLAAVAIALIAAATAIAIAGIRLAALRARKQDQDEKRAREREVEGFHYRLSELERGLDELRRPAGPDSK